MNIVVQLSHPAHFHLYKNVINQLQKNGHSVYVLIKSKDILEELVRNAGYNYVNINAIAHRGSKLGIIWDMVLRDWQIIKICLTYKINLLIGSTPEVSQIGWLLRKNAITTTEDDAVVIPKFEMVTAPFLDALLAPNSCNTRKMEPNTIHYPGFQKLAYLHPNRFSPSKDVVSQYGINPDKPYFLMRFAQLNAHHDKGVSGINTEVAQHLINMLSPYGCVYITSERELEPEFEQYRLHINPLDIHHVMAFATIYMGDSQSMAVEAAMLGTPSLRFNDFVGAKKIGVMEELEHTYGLTFGISSHCPDQLYAKLQEMLDMGGGLRDEFQTRRQRMLADKIDVTAFFTWFVENFPQSAQDAKRPDFNWSQFR